MRRQRIRHAPDTLKIESNTFRLALGCDLIKNLTRDIGTAKHRAEIAIDIHACGWNRRIDLKRLPADDGDTGALQLRKRSFQTAHREVAPG